MKRSGLALAMALLLFLFAHTALAYEIEFFMGHPPDEVDSLVVMVDSDNVFDRKLTVEPYKAKTGPGFILALTPMEAKDPCYNKQDAPRPRTDSKNVYLPGIENITKLLVQMSDAKEFNQKHRLVFTWLNACHSQAQITAEPK